MPSFLAARRPRRLARARRPNGAAAARLRRSRAGVGRGLGSGRRRRRVPAAGWAPSPDSPWALPRRRARPGRDRGLLACGGGVALVDVASPVGVAPVAVGLRRRLGGGRRPSVAGVSRRSSVPRPCRPASRSGSPAPRGRCRRAWARPSGEASVAGEMARSFERRSGARGFPAGAASPSDEATPCAEPAAVCEPVPGRLRPRPPRRRLLRAGAAVPLPSAELGCRVDSCAAAASVGTTAESIPASLTKHPFLSGHAGRTGHARAESGCRWMSRG